MKNSIYIIAVWALVSPLYAQYSSGSYLFHAYEYSQLKKINNNLEDLKFQQRMKAYQDEDRRSSENLRRSSEQFDESLRASQAQFEQAQQTSLLRDIERENRRKESSEQSSLLLASLRQKQESDKMRQEIESDKIRIAKLEEELKSKERTVEIPLPKIKTTAWISSCDSILGEATPTSEASSLSVENKLAELFTPSQKSNGPHFVPETLEQARAMGATDAQILDVVSEMPGRFKYKEASKAGYSLDEIAKYLKDKENLH